MPMLTLFVRLSFLVNPNLIISLEHKQIHPSDEERSITDGIPPSVSHIFASFHSSRQGWLWSRLGFTASNFVIEVEFKVGNFWSTCLSSLLNII